jgi:predicted RNA binding protein YcfA (HicA-like mRNA interferase family)
VHAGKDVRTGTLPGIIKSAGMTADEFLALDR